MKNAFVGFMVCAVVLSFAEQAFTHCQIPCGIYDDEMRFDMISEDIDTVEKSMKEVQRLSRDKEKDYNQLIRWVENKDLHSDKIAETVTYYFMAQRIKPAGPGDKECAKKLSLLHEMLVYSMKAKQTTDLSNVEKMRETLKEFKELYFKD